MRLSRPTRMAALVGSAVALLCAASTAHGITYGLKSENYFNQPPGQYSGAPTHLFTFREDGSQFTDLGELRLGGAGLDADGLAIGPGHGLLAFQLTEANDKLGHPRDARLIAIDPTTATATPVGAWLTGRDIRGAVFDAADRLWAVDALGNELLEIDPTDGSVIAGSAVPLALADVDTSCDLAVDADGTFWLTSLDRVAGASVIHTLDPATGAVTAQHSDPGQGLVGLAFSQAAGPDDLFAFDVNMNSVPGLGDNDDVFRYDVANAFARTVLHGNVIQDFNAGRGDLAALIVPEPVTVTGLLIGFGSLGSYLRRRRPA